MRDQANDDARRFEMAQDAPTKGSRMPSTTHIPESGLKDYYVLPDMLVPKDQFIE